MKRLLMFVLTLATLFGTALVATRTVFAVPQHRGSSTLSGVVLGPNDKPVARAVITYQSSAGSAPHVVRTDAHGRFSVAKLPADNYDLRASANGIFSEWQKNVSIRSGETHSVTLRLIYAKQMPKPGTITAGTVK
jgi:Carboxypeptidase regulatory-like domain